MLDRGEWPLSRSDGLSVETESRYIVDWPESRYRQWEEEGGLFAFTGDRFLCLVPLRIDYSDWFIIDRTGIR